MITYKLKSNIKIIKNDINKKKDKMDKRAKLQGLNWDNTFGVLILIQLRHYNNIY